MKVAGDYTWVIEVEEIINPSGVPPRIQITRYNTSFEYEDYKSINLSIGTNTLTYNLNEPKNLTFSIFLKYDNENPDVVLFSSMTVGGIEVPIADQP